VLTVVEVVTANKVERLGVEKFQNQKSEGIFYPQSFTSQSASLGADGTLHSFTVAH
jgi:hypothetical protein